MFYLQMQKPKHKRSKNKKPVAIARIVGERRLRPKNERYNEQLYSSKVSATLDYEEARDLPLDGIYYISLWAPYYAYEWDTNIIR